MIESAGMADACGHTPSRIDESRSDARTACTLGGEPDLIAPRGRANESLACLLAGIALGGYVLSALSSQANSTGLRANRSLFTFEFVKGTASGDRMRST
jgi:hypothetical protein